MARFQVTRRVVRRAVLVAAAVAVAAGVLATTGATQRDKGSETLTSARYVLEADGQKITFSELTGITSEVEQAEYMEAGEKGPQYGRFIGKQKPPIVGLKRVATRGLELSSWHSAALAGSTAAYRDATLTAYSPTGTAVLRYRLANAIPIKLELTKTRSGDADVLSERVTLTGDQLERLEPR